MTPKRVAVGLSLWTAAIAVACARDTLKPEPEAAFAARDVMTVIHPQRLQRVRENAYQCSTLDR